MPNAIRKSTGRRRKTLASTSAAKKRHGVPQQNHQNGARSGVLLPKKKNDQIPGNEASPEGDGKPDQKQPLKRPRCDSLKFPAVLRKSFGKQRKKRNHQGNPEDP